MKRNMFKSLSFILLITLFVSACKKKTEIEPIPTDTTTKETSEVQSLWDNALKISEDALSQNGKFESVVRTSTAGLLGCSQTVLHEVISDGNFIGQITIDFGASLTNACYDGKTRRGILVVKYTGKYRDANTVIEITTSNYYVNNLKVEGRRTVTNNGDNTYTVVDTGPTGTGFATLTTLDGKVTTWKSTRLRTWTAGLSTPTIYSDDVYVVSGSAEGISSSGDVYTMTIAAITVKLLCYSSFIYTPVSGFIAINSPAGSRQLNFGTGTCDRNVQYTHTNGKMYDITL